MPDTPVASVIIPAHNEAKSIGRLLDLIAAPDLEVLVVCNGCTDATADVARRHASSIRVLELTEASKIAALRAGDAATTTFPRLYIDADIEFSAEDVRRLTAALDEPDVRAAAPERKLLLDRSSWVVRSYHRIWSELPAVRTGLYGRGVFAVSETGHRALADRPDVTGDDLYAHSRFTARQRRIVADTTAVVRAPVRTRDLVRRKTRVAEGNAEQFGSTGSTSSESARAVFRMASNNPRLVPDLPAFLLITLAARVNRRWRTLRAPKAAWLRDESSR